MSDNYIATTNFSESTEALDLANSVQTTGWLSGGVTTIATVTTLDITECFGKIANYSTPSDADTETVRLTEKIGYAPTSIGSDGVVWLAFDGNDSVVEFTSLPSAQERMDYVFFAALQITGGEILSVSPTFIILSDVLPNIIPPTVSESSKVAACPNTVAPALPLPE